jgi:hypothetical protein
LQDVKQIIFLPLLIIFLLSVNLSSATFKEHKVSLPLSFDYYYTYDMVVTALEKLHKAYPDFTKLEIAGKSEEGRAIYCMTVNNPKTGKALSKPAILVDGNIHGNEIQGGEISLYLLESLLSKYDSNEEFTKLVDKNCFYVVPVVNPDGRYHFLAGEKSQGDNRGLRRPHDDDHDGLSDEDFSDDLDGDGEICEMRKRDPNGSLKSDPEDPRLLVRVKPGEKGEWTLLGDEGIDNDGDGRINEDSEGYVDPNRNWGHNWAPRYVESGGGDYPFSGVGLKALASYIRERPNICLYWSFHNFGGMYLRGPALKSEGDFPRQDVEVYDFLGEQGERITPDYRYIVLWKDLYETYGDSLSWMTNINGAFGFVAEVFMLKHETFKTIKEKKKAEQQRGKEEEGMMSFFDHSPEVERERLKFNDHLTQGELFKPWKPFKHPTLGDIEIGGWRKLSTRISHPFMLKELVHRNASVVLFSAKNTPEISLQVFEIKEIGSNLYRVRTRLKNAKAIPSMSRYAETKNLYPQDMLTLSGQGIEVAAGGRLTDVYRDKVTYKEFRPEIQFLTVPGFGNVEHQFLVTGKKGAKVTVEYNSRHAGNIGKTIELK